MSDSFYEGVAVWSQVVASLLWIGLFVYLWIRFAAPLVLASQARSEYNEALFRQIIALADLERATAGGFMAGLK